MCRFVNNSSESAAEDGRFLLLLSYSFEDAQSSQVILHFLRRIERGVAIRRDGSIVVGLRRFGCGATAAGVKESLRVFRPDCPKAAWPVQPVSHGRSFKAARSTDAEGGEIGIGTAQFEVVNRQFRVQAQACSLEIFRGGLGLLARRVVGPAHPPHKSTS